MNLDNLQVIITIALVILIVVFIFKKAIKCIIAVGAILILFNVGFIMNGAEVRNFFNLDNVLSIEQADKLENFFDDFENKRNEYEVIDPEIVYDGMTDGISKVTTIIIDGAKKIDIVKLSSNIADAIVNVGSENVNMDELELQIKESLSGIKDEDLQSIMDMINEKSDKTENK